MHVTSGEPRKFSAEKKYGLFPIGAIRGTANPNPRNTRLFVTDEAEPRVGSQFSTCDGVDGWEILSFYGNRFRNNKIDGFEREEKI